MPKLPGAARARKLSSALYMIGMRPANATKKEDVNRNSSLQTSDPLQNCKIVSAMPGPWPSGDIGWKAAFGSQPKVAGEVVILEKFQMR